MSNNDNSIDEDNKAGSGTTPSTVSKTKEKRRSWFHSLRKKKSSGMVGSLCTNSNSFPLGQPNNNNERPIAAGECAVKSAKSEIDSENPCGTGTLNKMKGKNNVFQRICKRVELSLSSIRPLRSIHAETINGGTTDATYEFVRRARFVRSLPFTHDYQRFIDKKWLERVDGPNIEMHFACTEMLKQVWYWGEISRRDAQRQLTDKPPGTFLVRDSESVGMHFTLSFRITNVTLHYRIEYWYNYWHFEELQYKSIVDMIHDILYRCTNSDFFCYVMASNEIQPPYPVILKYPLSRYLIMPKLQDLCRRVIQKHVSAKEIVKLPVPAPLLEYLSIRPELVFHS